MNNNATTTNNNNNNNMSSGAGGRGRRDGGVSRGGVFPPIRRGGGQAPRGACFKCGNAGHIARYCHNGNQPGPASRGAVNSRGTVQRGRGGPVGLQLGPRQPPAAPQPRAAPLPAATAQPTSVQPSAADIGTPVEHRLVKDSAQDGKVPLALATSGPPITWPCPTSVDEAQIQKRDFFDHYKQKGWEFLGDDDLILERARPTAHHPKFACNGETYFVSRPQKIGGFGSDLYEEDFSVYTGTMAQLPHIEAEREKELETAKAELQIAAVEAQGADKDRKVRGLQAQIRRLEAPLEVFMPPLRIDNEHLKFAETRKTDLPKDITANNAPRDTLHKFKLTIELMEAAGAFGEETVMEDGEEVTVNRKWKEGDVWRPKPENPDEEALWDEELSSTFHGFMPRHSRPRWIGLGHLGYDNVYTRSRDGESYTSKDLPDRQWNTSDTAPIVYKPKQGNTSTVQRSSRDVGLGSQSANVKPLRQILEENEKANANKTAQRARTNARWGGAGPSNENWN